MTITAPQHYYCSQGRWTDLGKYAPVIRDLPEDVTALAETVQGLLIHESWLHLYALTADDVPKRARDTQPVARRLDAALGTQAASLSCARLPAQREVGTCRDYALMLCAFLRHKTIPARVRCGFAAYFEKGRYEDHWVCEYWDVHDRRWAVADAQLDREHRTHLSIGFNVIDLPTGQFLSAGQAWHHFRDGRAKALSFGHGGACGDWFLRVNLARDLLALQKCEVSEWDKWREASESSHCVDDAAAAWCDDIAALITTIDQRPPEDREMQLRPFWQS